MSAEPDEDTNRVPGFVELGTDRKGRTILGMPYNESTAVGTVAKGLASKTQPETQKSSNDNESSTPDPESSRKGHSVESGPIRRFNDVFTDLGSVQLEALGLDGQEISNATATLRNEMFRSEFPVIQPRFTVKCRDDECSAEYDRDIDFCLECARDDMVEDGVPSPPTDPDEVPEEYQDNPVRPPDPTEKRRARRLAESINKEGQSLRGLMKMEEDDQSRLGVSAIIVKKNYAVAEGDTSVYDRGEMIYEEADELLRGDPKRVVPVVDENGRIGGHWWTCPVHREESKVTKEEYEDDFKRRCPECGADLREVHFAETTRSNYSRSDNVDKLYFEDEVVTWARYFPRLHGLDGLSPIHHVWLKQSILHWMNIYGGAFYDPDSERYPNKFMVVHTTNPQTWEKQLDKAEEDAKENPYSEQIMFNEYSGESNTTPEVQVIDLMSDELLGQDEQMKDQYKQDIRTHFGVTNVFESELSDAGGLNNEGLQMEVTDRTIASAMNDTVEGPLDELAKVLGIDDFKFEFVPPQDTNIDELRNHVEVGKKADNAGLDARLEDDKVEISDGDFEAEDDEEGGLGGLFGADFEGEEPLAKQAAERARSEDEGGSDGDGADSERPWRTDGTERTPAETEARGETRKKRRGPVRFGNVGGDPFEEYEQLESFCGDLEDAGGEVMLGDEPWEYASGHHDRPVVVYGLSLEEAESAWEDHEDNALAISGPKLTDEKVNITGLLDDITEKADLPTFTIVATEDDDRFEAGSELGWGVEFPNSGCYVDWNVDAWPDDEQLGGPHVSEYDSIEDATTVAEGDIVFEGGEEGNGHPADAPTKEEKLEDIRKLDDAFEHIVWADETTKASPFWDDDGSMPDFVLEVIGDVVPDAISSHIESIPGAIESDLIELFTENLTQPQGWSLESITTDIMDTFGADRDDAELVARSETANVLNNAREEGYERTGALDDDDRLFRWIGPDDHRTTDACEWLREETEDGVTYDRLIELQKEAYDLFDDEIGHLEWRKHLIHPNERHTFTETFKMDHPGAAGPVEMEYDHDWSPAVTGTFKAVT